MAARIDPLFEPGVVEEPHGYYAQLRRLDPVHELAGTGAFLVTRSDLIHEVVADPDVFSSHSNHFLHLGDHAAPSLLGARSTRLGYGGLVLATADPPDHGRQRRVVGHLLSTTAMQAMELQFRALVDAQLDTVLPTGSVEWMGQIAEPLPMVMVARILGLPDETAPQLKKQGYASVERLGGFVSDERLAELNAPMTDVDPLAEAYKVVRNATRRGTTTLIGVCAQAVADGDLDDVEALAILALVVSAGGESTTSLMGTGIRLLAEDMELQDRLRRAPQLIPAFVEEACRIDPPFRGHYRRVVADTELGGVAIPAGATLVLVWTAANRDEDAFARPDEIDLERPNPRQHMGFGWGIHLCLGAPLARVEARVAFEQLLDRTTSFSVDPAGLPLRHHRSLMIRRLIALPLILEARLHRT